MWLPPTALTSDRRAARRARAAVARPGHRASAGAACRSRAGSSRQSGGRTKLVRLGHPRIDPATVRPGHHHAPISGARRRQCPAAAAGDEPLPRRRRADRGGEQRCSTRWPRPHLLLALGGPRPNIGGWPTERLVAARWQTARARRHRVIVGHQPRAPTRRWSATARRRRDGRNGSWSMAASPRFAVAARPTPTKSSSPATASR